MTDEPASTISTTPREQTAAGSQIAVLAGLAALGTLATNILLPSLPPIAAALRVSSAAVTSAITVFLVVFALGQLAVGPISDRKAAAQKIGLQFKVLEAANSEDLDAVFATLQGTDAGLLVNSDPYFTGQRAKIVALAAHQRIPAIYPWREYVDEGGMMSYGSDNIQAYRIAGNYAGRLIKGTKVQDLPVWQANKLSLVLNLKGASGVGVKFPAHMIALADDVIE